MDFYDNKHTALQHDILRLIKFNFQKATIFIPVLTHSSSSQVPENRANFTKTKENQLRKNGLYFFIFSKEGGSNGSLKNED